MTLTDVVVLAAIQGIWELLPLKGSAMAAENLLSIAWPSLVGMLFSFVAGLVALKWLSRWLEQGRWHFFGYYCLGVAISVLLVEQFLR